jgi:pimeloyl-ACP methyl ester carboxylesterase
MIVPLQASPASPTQGASGLARTRDGRELFYQALPGPAGSTAPVVVFESGLAASRSFWGLVQPRVAQWTRAVAYDRSGLGRSAPDPQPRTVGRMAADLDDLLDHLAPGPFVLVAHSGGGPIVRAAAAARPQRIAGLVLVDVSDEACAPIFEKSFVRLERTAHRASWLLARLGLLEACYRKPMAPLPGDVRNDLHREGFTMAVMRTRGAELAGLRAALEAFRDHPPVLPDIPVTVISGALADFGMSRSIRDAANAAHRHRAAQSRQGRHVVAGQSGHAVVLTEPGLVADEIHRMLALAAGAEGRVAPDATAGNESAPC